jgi:hypothetical protein
MRPQGLPTTIASDYGRVRTLMAQRCTIQGDILLEIIEVDATGIALKGLSRSAVCKNDIVAFQLYMQVINDIPVRWRPSGDADPVDEIPCRNQQAIYKKSVPIGHVEITVWQVAIERTARNLYWKNRIVPRCLAVPLKPHAPDPFDRFRLARDGQDQVTNPQVVYGPLALRGKDLRSLQEAMRSASTVAMALAIAVPITIAVSIAVAVTVAVAIAASVALAVVVRHCLSTRQHYSH